MNKEKLCIGYQGVIGSYSYEALMEYYKNQGLCKEDFCTINVNIFEDVFKLLEEGKVKYGVLPVENSSTGGISEVIDLLYKYNAYIVGEHCLKIEHSLLGIKGAGIEDIQEVYSHPQGFLQSKDFLSNYPQWKLISYGNTAKSVEFIKEKNNKHFGAIASRKTAEIYDVEILKSNINFNSNNYTKFIVVGKEPLEDTNADKVSIVLSLAHTSGSLFKVIKSMADNGLNMLKIESRPIINVPWEYLFYIDFEGNLKDGKVINAIEEIKAQAIHFRLLGNYKCDK